MLDKIVAWVSDTLYSYVLIILLVAGGIYFTFRTKFAQFRLFREQLRSTIEKPADQNGVSSFQALMVSTASRVDAGNIIGVSTVLCLGRFSSSCVMYGITRSLFSNEAGVGSAPNVSASVEVKHPIKQGLVQVISVFIDTILICSTTVFMCMCSGVEPSAALSGAPYIQAALPAIKKF